MQRLALYFDVGTEPWTPDGDWKHIPVETWDKFFQPGISAAANEADHAPKNYVLPPIDGQLKYLRRGPNVRSGDEEAIQEADVKLETVGMQITRESSLYSLIAVKGIILERLLDMKKVEVTAETDCRY